MPSIDLNADVGEGMATDAELLTLVSSCNIACAAHAGDEATMRRTIRSALAANIAIGAHPGYADRANFGRVVVPLSPAEISALVSAQLARLATIAAAEGARITHVKPHGALYNLAADDATTAAAIAHAVVAFDPQLILVGLAQSALVAAGAAVGLGVAHEAFIDRAYTAAGRLRPRSLPNAVHHDPAVAIQQALALSQGLPFPTDDGTPLSIQAQTLCIHGDTPAALEFARSVRAALAAAGIAIAPLPQVGR